MSKRSSTGDAACMLAVNANSSSIRFALYNAAEPLLRRARGKIERIGLPDTTLTVDDSINARAQNRAIEAGDHSSAASALIDWLDEAGLLSAVKAVGHRVVHGGLRYSAPARVDDELLQELRRAREGPAHSPACRQVIRARERPHPAAQFAVAQREIDRCYFFARPICVTVGC